MQLVSYALASFLGLVWVLHACWRCEAAAQLDLRKMRVFGPGIHPKRSQLPVNYFYIQAVDTLGNKLVYI